jgi:hypothetical protein
MRPLMARVLSLLAILLALAPLASARDRCSAEGSTVNCGFRCAVYGSFSGYCTWTDNALSGCVQLANPLGCGSASYVECCDPEAGSGSF